jgi:hypothetical protein
MPTFFSSRARPLAALALLLASAGAAHAQTPAATFGSTTNYSTGNSIRAVAVADVNGDGKPDLLTANQTGTAGVLLGTGNGTFGTATTFSTGTGSSPFDIVVADVNGDGKLDLLTANPGTSTAGVLLGNGNGTFGAVATFSSGTGSRPESIAVADVNGDGKLDLLTANGSTNTAGVLLGNGNGTFGTVSTFSTGVGSTPNKIVVADVNGDSQLDLLTLNEGTYNVGVLLGTGTGTFGAVTNYSTGGSQTQISDIAIADVNGDGKPDLLAANYGTDEAAVRLGTGMSTGTFGPLATFNTGNTSATSAPTAIAVADVNGDGKLDLLAANQGTLFTANQGSSSVGVLLGNGNGTFAAAALFGTGSNNPTDIAVADVSGDGKPDLLTGNLSTGAGVLLNTTSLPLTLMSTSPTANARAAATTTAVTATFNQAVTSGSTAALKVFSAQRGGLRTGHSGSTTASGSTVSFVPTYAFKPGETVQATVTGATSAAGGSLAAARVVQFTTAVTGGAGTFSGGSDPALDGPSGVAVGDVDGDGDLDLLTASARSSGTVSVRLNNGSGLFSGGSDPAVGSNPTSVVLGDVDGDGDLDLLTANLGAATVSVRLNNGSGVFSGGSNPAVTGTPADVALGDVDGDGDLDLLATTSGTTSNTVSVRLNNGSGVFSGGSDPVVGNQPYRLAVGDVDGDGDLDLLTANYGGATVSVRLNNGSGVFSGGSDPAVGNNPRSVALGDVDGDGDLDLLTASQSGGTVSVRLNNGSGVFSGGSNPAVGGQPLSVALGDVDGDGDLDLLAANASSNTVSVRLNNGSGVFSGGVDPAVGRNPYSVAVGDVDGDGDLDLLTANNGSSTVSVRLNQNPTPPSISSLSPTSGPVGTSITITGSNLTGTTGVRFNGTAATTFTVVNVTTVTATVPTGATSGPVTVATAIGTSNGVAFAVSVPTNNALAFDGTDDYVSGINAALPQGSTARTLEAWVNANTSSGNGLIAYGVYATNARAGISLLNNRLYYSGGSNDLAGNIVMPAGTWHHVAATYDGTTLRLYVDGVLDVAAAKTFNTTANGFLLGYSGNGNGEYLNGRLDEVRIYNVALTQAQVQADMYSTASAVPASQIAYYSFNQGTAGGTNTSQTTLTDQSGNGRTGTLTNFALTGTASNFVRSFPTITAIAPATGSPGTSVRVTGTNLTDATSFAFNGTAVAPFTTPTNDLSATVVVPSGATTGPVSVASAALAKYNGPVFTVTAASYPDLVIDATTTSIAAGIYNSITVRNGGYGALAGDVVVNTFVLVTGDNSELNTDGYAVRGAATFTLAAGTYLDVTSPLGLVASGATGSVQVTGTRSLSPEASYYYYLISGTSQVTGNGLPGQVRNLYFLDNTNLTLTQATSVAEELGLAADGNLLTNGQPLTLLSNATGTALQFSSGLGVVVGAVTVQRYIDGSLNPATAANPQGLGYRHYSAPVSNTTVADLTTTGFAPVLTQAYNTSATPGLTTPFPNVFGYDQSRLASVTNNYSAFDKGWLVPAATTTALVPGQGYAVNIGSGQLVDFVGTLNTGDLTVSLSRNAGSPAADAGWNLVGNPYPAPLDYSQMQANDLQGTDRAIYVVQSTSQYMGGYRTYVNGVSTGDGFPNADPALLAAGQGFFVRVSPGQTTGAILFHDYQRITHYADQAAFQRTTVDARPRVRLELAGAGLADAFIAYAEAGATSAFDGAFDAAKLANPTGLNLSSVLSTENLAIDGQPSFTASTVLPLAVGVPAAGTYSLSATALNNLPAGLSAYLRDSQTGQTVLLAAGTSYSFSVTAAQAATLLTGRFTLLFRPQAPLATVTALTATDVTVYPNPAHASFTVALPGVAGASTVQAELLNALGQVVRRQAAALPTAGTALTMATADLAAGVYVLRLQAGAATLTKRVVVQ